MNEATISTHENLFAFMREQLSTDPIQSKKFLMAVGGIGAILTIVIAALIIFCLRPQLAPQLVAVVTIAVPSLAGVASVYLGAQGAVEVKANGVLQQQARELVAGKSD